MNRKIKSLAGILPLIAGCVAPVALTSSLGNVTLAIRPQVKAGGYCSQGVITPYVQSDINHLQIKLFSVASSTETPVLGNDGNPLLIDLPVASLSAQVAFNRLHLNTTYRIRAYAYSTAGTDSLISTTDSGSYVDVAVLNNDRPALTTLPVQLINKTFSGAATASAITVSTGSISNEGTETVTVL